MTLQPVDHSGLRCEMRARRASLSPAHRIAAAQQVAAQLHALPLVPASGHVAGYWAVDGEIALHAWQVSLPTSLSYCLPVLGDDGILRFAPWRAGDPLVSNRFGIPEPDVSHAELLDGGALALVVTPLVAFDAACHRVGMGGGWYDRTFAAARGTRPRLVGVGYDVQRVDQLQPADWDVPLDAVCSESSTFIRRAA